MCSVCTLRLNRRKALSMDSPSCSRTSAKESSLAVSCSIRETSVVFLWLACVWLRQRLHSRPGTLLRPRPRDICRIVLPKLPSPMPRGPSMVLVWTSSSRETEQSSSLRNCRRVMNDRKRLPLVRLTALRSDCLFNTEHRAWSSCGKK